MKTFEVVCCVGKCKHGAPARNCDTISWCVSATSEAEAEVRAELELDTRWPGRYLVNRTLRPGVES